MRTQEIGGDLDLEYDDLTETSILPTCMLTNLRCGHNMSVWPDCLKPVAFYQHTAAKVSTILLALPILKPCKEPEAR